MSPEAGQPYRLNLLHALAKSWGDPDMALLPFLQHGVPTGAPARSEPTAFPAVAQRLPGVFGARRLPGLLSQGPWALP